MPDSWRLYGPQLRELLAPGEAPVAAVGCAVSFGADRLERSPDEIEHSLRFLPRGTRERAVGLLRGEAPQREPGSWEKALDKVVDAVSGDLVRGDPDAWLGGVASAGHVGSFAHRLAQALSTRELECMVTDRRVVFAGHRRGGDGFEELATVPRRAVLAARRAGRFLQRGRVVLDFADLSQLAVTTGMLSTGQARRLVAALAPETASD